MVTTLLGASAWVDMAIIASGTESTTRGLTPQTTVKKDNRSHKFKQGEWRRQTLVDELVLANGRD
jgi:hypothetical protein